MTLSRWISGWYASLDETLEKHQYSTAAHELMHQFSALDDMYVNVDHATFTRVMTLMSSNAGTSTHLDPVHKLALGWVTPRLVDDDLQIGLTMVESSNRCWCCRGTTGPRTARSTTSSRTARTTRRRPVRRRDSRQRDRASGTPPATRYDAAKHPIGVTQPFWDKEAASAETGDEGNGTMGRWGIRLLRSWTALTTDGVAVFTSKDNTLWDNTEYELKSGVCPAVFLGEKFKAFNVLAWADCTASGYGVKNLSAPANTMTVKITH